MPVMSAHNTFQIQSMLYEYTQLIVLLYVSSQFNYNTVIEMRI